MPNHAMASHETRSEPRDEVMHRTRATDADGNIIKLVLVNVSPSGLMARCEGDPGAGDRLRVNMPMIGESIAQVRWSLGGRIGCSLERAIPLDAYYGMLSVMVRNS